MGNKYTCPKCSSDKTSVIGTMVDFANDDVRETVICDDCGCKWHNLYNCYMREVTE
jgi:transcription elongation factor Elf1